MPKINDTSCLFNYRIMDFSKVFRTKIRRGSCVEWISLQEWRNACLSRSLWLQKALKEYLFGFIVHRMALSNTYSTLMTLSRGPTMDIICFNRLCTGCQSSHQHHRPSHSISAKKKRKEKSNLWRIMNLMDLMFGNRDSLT